MSILPNTSPPKGSCHFKSFDTKAIHRKASVGAKESGIKRDFYIIFQSILIK